MIKCISCGFKKKKRFLDFGKIPISNEFSRTRKINVNKYQLGLDFCEKCNLVQNSKK